MLKLVKQVTQGILYLASLIAKSNFSHDMGNVLNMLESKADAIIVGHPDHGKVVLASSTGRGDADGFFNTQMYGDGDEGKVSSMSSTM